MAHTRKYSAHCLAPVGRFCFALVTVLLATVQMTQGAIIDTDFTIDAAHSFPGEGVTITDGISGPANVTMVPGGTVRGFTIAGNSTFEMTGGTSTFLSGLQEKSTLIMRGGSIECSSPGCLVIDYEVLLNVRGNSSIHVFGGVISGIVGLAENGSAHYYGRNLTLSVLPGGVIVEGEFAGGEPPGGFGITSLEPLLDLSTHIFLHEIPEPSSVANAITGILLMVISVGRFRMNLITAYL